MVIRVLGIFYVAVSRARGVPPPLGEGAFSLLCLIQFGDGSVDLMSPKRKIVVILNPVGYVLTSSGFALFIRGIVYRFL